MMIVLIFVIASPGRRRPPRGRQLFLSGNRATPLNQWSWLRAKWTKEKIFRSLFAVLLYDLSAEAAHCPPCQTARRSGNRLAGDRQPGSAHWNAGASGPLLLLLPKRRALAVAGQCIAFLLPRTWKHNTHTFNGKFDAMCLQSTD